ncbi:hypothetical protein HYH03_003610 [Edaphochlamys debaryana]|uniref:Uncharacterized protein n=1 Tax=Edaphochlamys debaryana TaxID=47281 RepID=A0A835YCL5_9CHLO|nr:hypothetical protein HYH03_003610 [Edaphochlamys debaryana]|eukprot:KAG2498351.1 hypothetical protein HYH03_003610 [Edaphochlamys debaryana]
MTKHGRVPPEAEHAHDDTYNRVMDPNSDFPEPALKGEHLQSVMKCWMPSPPTSPPGGTSGGAKTRKHTGGGDGSGGGGQSLAATVPYSGGAGMGGGKHLPMKGVRGGVEVRDDPNQINHDVREFLAKEISPHGHAHTARGVGGGYGEAPL